MGVVEEQEIISLFVGSLIWTYISLNGSLLFTGTIKMPFVRSYGKIEKRNWRHRKWGAQMIDFPATNIRAAVC